MKRLSLIAVPLLLLGLLAGCGADDSSTASDEPTTSASGGAAADDERAVTAFCDVVVGMTQVPQGGSDADAVKLLKDVADQFERAGVPSDMPEGAQRALQAAIDAIRALPDDATQEEVSKAAQKLSEAQAEDQAALGAYVQEKCLGGLPTEPTTSPSGG